MAPGVRISLSPPMFKSFEQNTGNTPVPEKKSGVTEVVGVPAETREKTLEIFADIFESVHDQGSEQKNALRKNWLKFEQEKTAEEIVLIEEICDKLQDFTKKYGAPPLNISPEHIVFIDKKKLNLITQIILYLDGVGAIFSPRNQTVAVFPQMAKGSKLRLAHLISHELMHFNSFQSFNLDSDQSPDTVNSEKLKVRRTGFVVRSKDNDEDVFYFNSLNEAVTEELTKRFDHEYFSIIPILEEDVKKRDDYVGGYENNHAFTDTQCLITHKRKWFLSTVETKSYAYRSERVKFNRLVNNIFNKNKDTYSSTEQVFDVFARAYFNGNLLEVARLIEKTFGKGSFSEIAEKDAVKASKIDRTVKESD